MDWSKTVKFRYDAEDIEEQHFKFANLVNLHQVVPETADREICEIFYKLEVVSHVKFWVEASCINYLFIH